MRLAYRKTTEDKNLNRKKVTPFVRVEAVGTGEKTHPSQFFKLDDFKLRTNEIRASCERKDFYFVHCYADLRKD